MSISWIEKKITKEKFIITENGKYTFEEFFDLIIQYYSFAKKNINSKERVCFISNHVIQYAIFSNIIPMLGGIFVPLNPKSPKEEIESKMNLIGSKKIIYDESIEIPNIKNIYKLKAKKVSLKMLILFGLMKMNHFVYCLHLEVQVLLRL